MNRTALFATALVLALGASARAADNTPPAGFEALFNGKDLAGWKSGKEGHWKVEDGVIAYDGKGSNLVSERSDFRNFVLHVDWKLTPKGDSGVFPRGEPQVQIWDNPEGSGGLWNDKVKALTKADKPIGEWNHFEIIVENDKITVLLNGEKVVDAYAKKWKNERGPIHLQNHGNPLWFKNIYVKALPD
jgi:hypothetical protein